jgi:hypothetical protein
VLPSVPVTVTAVALVPVTVKVEDPPEVIEVGLAVMLAVGTATTAGVTVTDATAEAFPPLPVALAV